jgi:hypothetical protein
MNVAYVVVNFSVCGTQRFAFLCIRHTSLCISLHAAHTVVLFYVCGNHRCVFLCMQHTPFSYTHTWFLVPIYAAHNFVHFCVSGKHRFSILLMQHTPLCISAYAAHFVHFCVCGTHRCEFLYTRHRPLCISVYVAFCQQYKDTITLYARVNFSATFYGKVQTWHLLDTSMALKSGALIRQYFVPTRSVTAVELPARQCRIIPSTSLRWHIGRSYFFLPPHLLDFDWSPVRTSQHPVCYHHCTIPCDSHFIFNIICIF